MESRLLQKRPACALPVKMLRFAFVVALSLAVAAPVGARESLGVFSGWGAFRDADGPRCYAIAEPARRSGENAPWRAFASIGNWPAKGMRGQVQVRLSRERRTNASVTLGIGDRRFALKGGAADAWAADRRADAAIIAAIRSGSSMSVASVDARGRPFADVYPLRGAATAIDAAALGCARRG